MYCIPAFWRVPLALLLTVPYIHKLAEYRPGESLGKLNVVKDISCVGNTRTNKWYILKLSHGSEMGNVFTLSNITSWMNIHRLVVLTAHNTRSTLFSWRHTRRMENISGSSLISSWLILGADHTGARVKTITRGVAISEFIHAKVTAWVRKLQLTALSVLCSVGNFSCLRHTGWDWPSGIKWLWSVSMLLTII